MRDERFITSARRNRFLSGWSSNRSVAPPRHGPEIRMILYKLDSHHRHELVETSSGRSLEPRINGPGAPNSEHDLVSRYALLHHLGYRSRVILEIGIDRNDDVAVLRSSLHSSKQCRLMPGICREANAGRGR